MADPTRPGRIDRNPMLVIRSRGALYSDTTHVAILFVSASADVFGVTSRPVFVSRFCRDQERNPYTPIDVRSWTSWPATFSSLIPAGAADAWLMILDTPRLNPNSRICAVDP